MGKARPLVACGGIAMTLSACLPGAPSAEPRAAEPVAQTASPSPRGPSVLVHIASTYDARLSRLGDYGRVLEQCSAPCDRPMPLDGMYRIDGSQIRPSDLFRLSGAPGQRVVVTVSPRLRSSYAQARTVESVGVLMASVGFATLLIGAFGATFAHDANQGGPAPCTGCEVASVGGTALAIAGMALGLWGTVRELTHRRSPTSQRVEVLPAPLPPLPHPGGSAPASRGPEAVWPHEIAVPVLRLRF